MDDVRRTGRGICSDCRRFERKVMECVTCAIAYEDWIRGVPGNTCDVVCR